MKQSELFNDDRYEAFGELPEDYPRGEFKPLNPAFSEQAWVISGLKYKRKYYVDLSINECTCQRGHAWAWSDKGTKTKPDGTWYSPQYCTHKLRVMCGIIEGWPEQQATVKTALLTAYVKALATKYNPFETVSAFHKEIRRGDFEAAWFWGLILSAKRSLHGVIKYLLNIVYEETRDHDLAEYLIKLASNRDSVTLSNVAIATSWFCASKKKWELRHRFQIFQNEMLGYKLLADAYSPDVAKGAGIIPSSEEGKLKGYLESGLKSGKLDQFQRGWKGLQKMVFSDKHSSLDDYRYYLYEYLYDLAEKTVADEHPVWGVISVVNQRLTAGLAAGYHELNAIADALAGEPYDAGLLPADQRKRLLARPTPAIPLAYWPPIPLYAHDNHTYGGKALMRRYGHELKPGVEQHNLDFRWCGAYFGVCYRMLCQDQHGKVLDVPWSEVKWPQNLYKIVDMLWY